MVSSVELERPIDLHSQILDGTDDGVPTAAEGIHGERHAQDGQPRPPDPLRCRGRGQDADLMGRRRSGRSGLLDTPARVVRAYEEWFAGYRQNPSALLERTFDEIGGHDHAVEVHDIAFHSFCEHHMAAIHGKAYIAYMPVNRVVGISKLARLAEARANRLQIQERLTDDIARAIEDALQPGGVAVLLVTEHGCMTLRGVHAHGTRMVTRRMLGVFDTNVVLRREFLSSIPV